MGEKNAQRQINIEIKTIHHKDRTIESTNIPQAEKKQAKQTLCLKTIQYTMRQQMHYTKTSFKWKVNYKISSKNLKINCKTSRNNPLRRKAKE